MNKKIARNIWLINKYTKKYVKESQEYNRKIDTKIKSLQEKNSELLKEINL